MKKKKTNLWVLAAAFAASTSVASAQIQDSIGNAPSNTTILAHEAANGFDELALTYSGTGLVRNTDASTGYAGASGQANVFLRAGETFVVSLVNTSSCTTSDSLVFGIRKNINASNGSELKVQYESAPGVWTNLTFTALPTGSGTSHWYRRAAALPAGAINIQMRFRFINTTVGGTSTNPQFRIDDIALGCGDPFDCSQIEAPVLTALSDSIFCNGGTVSLLSSAIEDASYAFYEVINGVATEVQAPSGDIDYDVTHSGTYYVVQNFDGCVSQSNLVWIKEYESPTLSLSFSPSGPVAPSTTVTATAELANAGLFFSQYVEGTEFNKYLEIYNPTSATINLSGYEVRAYHNGLPFSAALPSFTISLTGSIASGATHVIRHTSATAWGGVSQQFTGDLQFNGDDALVLVNNSNQILDIFGSVGNDPGSQWVGNFGGELKGTENRTFIRKSCIYRGITVNPGIPGNGGFMTLVVEWDTATVDTVNSVVGLGAHNYGIDFSWAGTNGSFVGGDNIGASVDFTVGQQGSSILTASVTGLCPFNDCAETDNQGEIIIGGGRMATINEANEGVKLNTYPNPFTGVVNIAIETKEDGIVKIEVLDMMGKVVAVVGNNYVTAGKHQFSFDGSALNTGTYTARVIAGNSVQTIRLVKTAK